MNFRTPCSIPTAWKGVSEPLFYLAKIPTGLNISTMFLGYLAGTVVPFLIGDSAPALGWLSFAFIFQVSPGPARLRRGYWKVKALNLRRINSPFKGGKGDFLSLTRPKINLQALVLLPSSRRGWGRSKPTMRIFFRNNAIPIFVRARWEVVAAGRGLA